MITHYPDSCVFLELFSNVKGNKSDKCQSYFYNVGDRYQILISNLSYGEIARGLLKIEGDMNRAMAFHKINDILKNVQVVSPPVRRLKTCFRIKRNLL